MSGVVSGVRHLDKRGTHPAGQRDSPPCDDFADWIVSLPISAGVRCDAAPRLVHMVRCASGVIRTRRDSCRACSPQETQTQPRSIACRDETPCRAGRLDLPDEGAFPFKAKPAMVFPQEPPETPRWWYPWIAADHSLSTNVIAPLSSACASRNVSSTGASTSTNAFPIPTRWYSVISTPIRNSIFAARSVGRESIAVIGWPTRHASSRHSAPLHLSWPFQIFYARLPLQSLCNSAIRFYDASP